MAATLKPAPLQLRGRGSLDEPISTRGRRDATPLDAWVTCLQWAGPAQRCLLPRERQARELDLLGTSHSPASPVDPANRFSRLYFRPVSHAPPRPKQVIASCRARSLEMFPLNPLALTHHSQGHKVIKMRIQNCDLQALMRKSCT